MSNSSNDLTAKIRIDGDAKGAQQAIDSTDKGLQQLAGAGQKARSSTDQLSDSFAKLGIRSAAQIEADILEINQALANLARRANVTGDEFDRAWAAGQAQIAKLKAEMNALPVEESTRGIGGLTAAFSSLNGVLGALGISAVGQKFLDANLAADKLQKSLNAVNGDATKTASDLEFLKETASRLGINLESSASAFVKLAASAKGTSLEGKATRDIFTGLGSAMSQLGLSSAETERAFLAVAQMMGKGTIQAEELKGQLGDVLPGTMAIAARATGLTTQELGKLMETGGLLAEDFLPKFAAEAQKSFGGAANEVQGLSNTIERVKNSWSQAFKILGDTGVMASLAAMLGIVNEAFLLLATGVTTVVSGFFAFVKVIGVTAAAIVSMDFSHLKASLAEIGTELKRNIETMARLTGTSKLVNAAINDVGDSTQGTTAKVAAATVGWEKLVVVYDQAAKSAADFVEQTKRVTKANDDQEAVLVKLTQLSGNENDLLRVKEEAARKAATGADNLAQALDREAKALQAKVVALQEEIKGLKNVSEEKLNAIEEAKKAADAKTEEARAARSSADAALVAAAAAEKESAARSDNSSRVNELRDAYEKAALKVDVLKAAQASGINVSGELTQAQTAAAKAHALYSDALHDQTTKIGQNLALKQSQIGVEQAGIRLAIEQQRTIYEVAKARGDEYTAMRALLEMKRLEIKLAELTAQAKAAEAKAALLLVDAKWKELEAEGKLTEQKKAELEAQRLGAQAKQVEAQIASETAKRMRELTDELEFSGAAAGRAAGSYEGLAGKLDGVASSARNAAAAMSDLDRYEAGKYGNPTSDGGFLNGGHQADRQIDVMGELYRRGASVEEAKAAEKYYGELFARKQATQLTGNLGNSTAAAQAINQAIKQSLDEAIALARRELASGQAVNLGTSVDDLLKQQLAKIDYSEKLTPNSGSQAQIDAIKRAGAIASAQPATVHITIGGKTGTVNMASADDASGLADILRQLESDSARAY